ncbi:MAG: hypothetical protein WB384_26470 [Candidatus Sulfotelmatobacter sp.]
MSDSEIQLPQFDHRFQKLRLALLERKADGGTLFVDLGDHRRDDLGRYLRKPDAQSGGKAASDRPHFLIQRRCAAKQLGGAFVKRSAGISDGKAPAGTFKQRYTPLLLKLLDIARLRLGWATRSTSAAAASKPCSTTARK